MTLGRLVHWLLLYVGVTIVHSILLLLPHLLPRHRVHKMLCLLLLLGALLTGVDRCHRLTGLQPVDLLLLRRLDLVVQPDALILELLPELFNTFQLDLGLALGNYGQPLCLGLLAARGQAFKEVRGQSDRRLLIDLGNFRGSNIILLEDLQVGLVCRKEHY